MNKRGIGIGVALVAVIVIAMAAVGLNQNRTSPAPAQATTAKPATVDNSMKGQLTRAIAAQSADPTIANINNQDLIVNSYKTLADGWYLVTVNVPSTNGSTSYVLVRRDRDNSLTLMQDVTLNFDNAKMQRLKVPADIISQLPHEGDNESE